MAQQVIPQQGSADGQAITRDVWAANFDASIRRYSIDKLVIQCYTGGKPGSKIGPVIFFVTTTGEKYILGADRLGLDDSYTHTPFELKELSHVSIKDVKPGQDRNVFFMLILTEEGTVLSAGNNDFGQLGRSEQQDSPNFFGTVEDLEGIVQISAGGRHCLALRKDKVVLAWGFNKYQWLCGDCPNDVVAGPTPITIADGDDVVPAAIFSGQFYSTLLDEKGEVYLWGIEKSVNGQYNNDDFSPIHKIEMNERITQVSCGQRHVIALTAEGKVMVWGSRAYGRLGLGGSFSGHEWNSKVVVDDLKDKRIVLIKAIEDTSVAWCEDGQIFIWGRYKRDNLPIPVEGDVPRPLDAFAFGWWPETGGFVRIVTENNTGKPAPVMSIGIESQERSDEEDLLRKEKERLENANDILQRETAELECRLKQTVDISSNKQKELTELRKGNQDLRKRLDLSERKVKIYTGEKERYEKDIKELTKRTARADNRELMLKRELEKLKRENIELKAKRDSQKRRIALLQKKQEAGDSRSFASDHKGSHNRLSYDVIHQVAIHITDDWRYLGRNLELTDDELKVIEYKSQSIKDKSFRVLRKWFAHSSKPPTLETLVEALKATGKDTLAEEIADLEYIYSRPRTDTMEQERRVGDNRA